MAVAEETMDGSDDAEEDANQDIYDESNDILDHEEMSDLSNDNKISRHKDAADALLIPVMMIFLRTGSTIEICVMLGIVIFILCIILR